MNRIRQSLRLICGLLVGAGLSAAALAGPVTSPVPKNVTPVTDAITGSYMENKGQWDPTALFYTTTSGLDFWARKTGFTIDAYKIVPGPRSVEAPTNRSGRREGHVVHLNFLNSNQATGRGIDARRLNIDFLNLGGRGEAKGVRTYGQAMMESLYPGIDVRLYNETGAPRYDFIVKPGANPNQITLKAEGAYSVTVLPNGNLSLGTKLGNLEMRGLVAYQEVGASRVQVPAKFVVGKDRLVRFQLGSYDRNRTLVIDPLVYGTNFGGGAYDEVWNVATDTLGNAYFVGDTTSPNLPINAGPYGVELITDSDGFLCKLQGDAYDATYVCYLGSFTKDELEGVQVDQYGNVWVAGTTYGQRFLQGERFVLQQAEDDNGPRTITGGQFRLNYRGAQTANIEWNATAADVAAALNALPEYLLPPNGGFRATGGPLPANPVTIEGDQITFGLSITQKTREYFIDGDNAPNDSALQGIFYNDDPDDYGFEPNTGTFRLAISDTEATGELAWDTDDTAVVAALNALPTFVNNPPRVLPIGPPLTGPLFGTPVGWAFTTGDPNFNPEPRPLVEIIDNTVDGGLLEFGGRSASSFIAKFSPSSTSVLDPFINQVIRQFPGAVEEIITPNGPEDKPIKLAVRPVGSATGPVEIALVGQADEMVDVPGTPPPGSGSIPERSYLLYMRYTQGDTSVNVFSSRSSYIGGFANAWAKGVSFDNDGAVYVTGDVWLLTPQDILQNATLGPNSVVFYANGGTFPNANLLRFRDIFVRKYQPTGAYAYSAVVGGSGSDVCADMAVDASGNLFIAGMSGSFNFPRTRNVFDEDNVPNKGYVTKINANASAFLYSTGLRSGTITALAVDGRGNAYVGGITLAAILTPIAPFLDGQEAGLDRVTEGFPFIDSFLTVLNSTAVGLLYSSNAGENNSNDFVNDLHTDRNGSVWVAGYSEAHAILGPFGLPPVLLTDLAFKPYGDGSDGWLYKMRIGLPVLDTISVTPSQLAGGLGSTADLQVSLKAPAPPGGTVVTLRVLDSTYARFNTVTGPAMIRVTIPEGATTMTTPALIATRLVTAQTTVNLRAELDGDYVETRLTLRPWIDSFLLSTNEATGGALVDATVSLFQNAPAGGMVVTLSADSDRVVFPNGGQVTIPAGSKTVAFSINTLPVTAITDIALTATAANVSLSQDLRLVPPEINNLIINPNRVSGGEPSQGTVFLDGPTRVDTPVTLSQIGSPVTIPATVVVRAGQSQASFNIGTVRVPSNTNVRIQGALGTFTVEDTLFLDATDILNVQLNSYNVLGGALVDGRVNLTRPAGPTGLNIPMITNNSVAGTIIPVTVVVPPGATFGTFQVQTNVVPDTQTMRVVTNKPGGFNNTGVTLTVRGLSVSLVMNPTSVVGGIQNSIGTITLNNNEVAPTGGIKVNLSSSVPAALSVPPFVTIPAGARSITFTASSSATSFDRNVTITALLSPGNSVSAVVRVLAPRVTTLTISPLAVTGGQQATGTVRVDAPAPAGGLTLGLSSNTASAIVPASVTIPAGQTSATFTINTLAVPAKVNATIRAIGFSTSQSAILQIYPPSVSSFTFSPASVPGGSSSTGTIRVNMPAPVGGLVITLTNNNPTFISHPATVTIPAGQTQVSFTANTSIATRVIAVRVTAAVPDRGPVHGYLTITGTP